MLVHRTLKSEIFLEETKVYKLFINNLKTNYEKISNNHLNLSDKEKLYYKNKIKNISNREQLYIFLNNIFSKDILEFNSYIILLVFRKLLRFGIGIKEIEPIYKNLPWKKNPHVTTAMIEVMWKENNIAGAWQFLLDAKDQNKLNDEMILEMIRGYTKKEDLEKVDFEKTDLLYSLAHQLKINSEIYPYIYVYYLKVMLRNKNIKDSSIIQQIYDQACARGYQYHLPIIAQILISIAHFSNIDNARYFFNEIKEKMASSKNMSFAGSPSEIYIAMIQAEYLYSNPEESQAISIYEKMPVLEKENYSYLMRFFMAHSNYNFVRKIFDEHFIHQKPPTVACKYMMNALINDYLILIIYDKKTAQKKLDQAKEIYKTNLQAYSKVKYKIKNNLLYVDMNFHGESKGSAFVMLQYFFDWAMEIKKGKFIKLILIINCGKGSHSHTKNHNDFHPVKQALNDFLNLINQNYEYNLAVEEESTFIVTIPLTKKPRVVNSFVTPTINPWLDTSKLVKSFKMQEIHPKIIGVAPDSMDIDEEFYEETEEKLETQEILPSIVTQEEKIPPIDSTIQDWTTLATSSFQKISECTPLESIAHEEKNEVQNEKQYKTWNLAQTKSNQASSLSEIDWPELTFFSPRNSETKNSKTTLILNPHAAEYVPIHLQENKFQSSSLKNIPFLNDSSSIVNKTMRLNANACEFVPQGMHIFSKSKI